MILTMPRSEDAREYYKSIKFLKYMFAYRVNNIIQGKHPRWRIFEKYVDKHNIDNDFIVDFTNHCVFNNREHRIRYILPDRAEKKILSCISVDQDLYRDPTTSRRELYGTIHLLLSYDLTVKLRNLFNGDLNAPISEIPSHSWWWLHFKTMLLYDAPNPTFEDIRYYLENKEKDYINVFRIFSVKNIVRLEQPKKYLEIIQNVYDFLVAEDIFDHDIIK